MEVKSKCLQKYLQISYIMTAGFLYLASKKAPVWGHVIHMLILGQKRNAAYKHTSYMGVFYQSLANDLSQFMGWFLEYEYLGLS